MTEDRYYEIRDGHARLAVVKIKKGKLEMVLDYGGFTDIYELRGGDLFSFEKELESLDR